MSVDIFLSIRLGFYILLKCRQDQNVCPNIWSFSSLVKELLKTDNSNQFPSQPQPTSQVAFPNSSQLHNLVLRTHTTVIILRILSVFSQSHTLQFWKHFPRTSLQSPFFCLANIYLPLKVWFTSTSKVRIDYFHLMNILLTW